MVKYIVAVFVLFLSVPVYATTSAVSAGTQSAAMADCSKQTADDNAENLIIITGCTLSSYNGSPAYEIVWASQGYPTDYNYYYATFTGTPYQGGNCVAGYILPLGTVYNTSSSTGAASYNGCTLSMMLGGQYSGREVETGASSVPSGTTATASTPTSTTNSDGSQTYCDPSGNCASINPTTPINYGGGGANSTSSSTSSTTDSSTTDTSTTTSSSTTTGTISGSGSGGSGSGGSYSSTTTGTSTTSTTDPASTSTSAQQCTTGVCDVGNADGQIGTLYTPSQDTPQSVYSQFASSVQNSPIATAASGFFNVTVSGSCPSWTIAANEYWTTGFSFDFFCQSDMLSLLAAAGYVVLAVAAYGAFKIAIY